MDVTDVTLPVLLQRAIREMTQMTHTHTYTQVELVKMHHFLSLNIGGESVEFLIY